MAQSEVFHIKAIADFSQPEKEAARIRTKLDREINSAFRNMEKSFGQPLGHITGRMDEFASSLEASNARVIAFGASAGIVYQVSKAFRELVKNTIDVEKSMADIQVVLNANTKQLERYRSGIFNIAKQTGQSFSEVSKAATELARQGLDAEKTLVRLKDALVLSRLSGMDTLDSVEALTAAINGFGETVVNSTALVNKFATVDQKFAVSSQDLAEAFKRVGSTAVDAGVSIDELIALVTSAQQITARGGSVIGNSFKTIFTRVQRPQVLQDLEEAGIKVKNFSGESLKAVDILTNLAKSYDTLSSSQKSFVSEAVGGVFQINVLKALLKDIDGDFSIFSRALDASATASDAAAKKNELLNKTLDSLINKSVENLREFSVVLGEVTVKPIIVKTLSAINSVVETIVKNKEGLGTVLDIIGKFVSGPVFGLIAGSLIRLFAGFSKYALQAGAQIAGLTKRQEDVARIQNLINNLLISQPELYKQIQTGAISVEQAEKRVLNILRQQSAERAKMMQFSSGAASTVFASGVRVDTKKKTLTGAGIPNLANPLREAIQREVGSGIPKSAIRIGSDSRLASSSNPSGIGVYNTIDEPMGIGQGISRSQRMGINPKTAGIPNFAGSLDDLAREQYLREGKIPSLDDLAKTQYERELLNKLILQAQSQEGLAQISSTPSSINPFGYIPPRYSGKGYRGSVPIIGQTQTPSGLVITPSSTQGMMQGPSLPTGIIKPYMGPRTEEERAWSLASLKNRQEQLATEKRFSTAETGYTDAQVRGGKIAVQQKSMAKEFAKEFEKVLLDPKISDAEKKATIDAVSKGLDKAGTFVSVKRVGELLNPEFKQETFRKFLKDYENTNLQFDKKQADRLQKTIYEAGFGGKATPLLQAGSVGYRRPTSLFKTEQDIATGQFYAVSEKTGKRTSISEGVARRIQKQNEILSKTLEPYILSDEEIRDRSSRMSKMEAPLGVGRSVFADSTKVSKVSEGSKRIYKYLRNKYPNLSPIEIKQSMDELKQSQYVSVTGSNAFNYSTPTRRQSQFPTFGSMMNVFGSKNEKGSYYQRLRNMDPMNKMMLLGGIGMAASAGTGAYERMVAQDNSLSGMQKKNRNLVSGAIGNVMTGAMIGGSLTAGTGIGMLGGAAIGGAISAAFSINEILKNWNDILPDLQKNLEVTSSKIEKLNSVSQGISSVLFKIGNAPEFKTDAERQKWIQETDKELRMQMARRGLGGASRQAVFNEISSGKPIEEIIVSIQKIFQKEAEAYSPQLALQELTAGLIQSQREGKSMDFAPLIGGVYSRRFGTVSGAAEKLSTQDKESLQGRLSNILGIIGTIENQIPVEMLRYNAATGGHSAVLSSKRSDILRVRGKEIKGVFSTILEDIGVDKTSEDFKRIMESVNSSLKDGPESMKSLVESIKDLIPATDSASESIGKLLKETVASVDNLADRISGRLKRLSSIYSDERYIMQSGIRESLSKSNYMRSFEAGAMGLRPMTSVRRDIEAIKLQNRYSREELPFQQQLVTNQLAQTVISQRKGLSSLFSEQASGAEKQIGQSLDSLYESITYNLSTGNFQDAKRELENSIEVFTENASKMGGSVYEGYLPALQDLKNNFIEAEIQTKELSKATERQISLSQQQIQLLERRIGPNALGSDLRSLSAAYNAERRMGGIDPSKEITSSFRAFREEMGYTVNDFYTDFENSARDAAQTFKSEFKSAFNDFRRGALDAGEALRQFAINVLDRIATNASNMAIDSLLNAAFGGASNIFANVRKSRTGGMVRKRYADGGMVTGGSGVVDDVPALLTSGEMVINREAVRTYGADYFNKINQGRGARAKLENRFLYLDDKGNISSSPTQGEARVSAALSNIGATNELMRANTDRFSREQRFVAYVQQRRAYNEQRSQAMKRYEKGIRQQAIAAGVSAGIGIGGSAIGSYFDNRNFANNAINSYQFPSSSTSTSYGPALPPSQGVIGFKSSNSGSIVPNFGSSNRDNIPYSLTGGEAVLRKEAVSMYGQQFVKDLNNGQVKTMRFGSQQSGSDVYSDLRNLPSSIDRLSSAITNLENRSSSSQDMNPNGGINNEFTFNIEIKSDSGNVSVQSGNMEQNKTGSGASEQDMKKIGEAVKGVVEQSISANLRPGGQIYNAIRRR